MVPVPDRFGLKEFRKMKNKSLVIGGSGVCLLFVLFFGCGEKSGEKEYGKALSSWKNGDLSRAQGQMEKAIRKLSDTEKKSVANNQLGLILWGLGKNQLATEKFGESCRLTEDLTGANLNHGLALYQTGQLESALFEFTKFSDAQPNNALAHTLLSLVHLKNQQWANATQELATGLQQKTEDPAAGQNALALAQLHEPNGTNKAITRLKQIIAAYPHYAPALYNLAVIYDQWLHDNTTALSWYRKYLQQAGSQARKAEQTNQAIARLTRTRPRTQQQSPAQTAKAYIAAGLNLHDAKNYAQAMAQYKKAIALEPSNKTAHYYLGLSAFALKNYSEAVRANISTLKIDPSDANARYMLTLSYAKQRKWNDAQREAKALEKIDPERGATMLNYISTARTQ